MGTNYQRFIFDEYCNCLDGEVLDMIIRTGKLLACFNALDILEKQNLLV